MTDHRYAKPPAAASPGRTVPWFGGRRRLRLVCACIPLALGVLVVWQEARVRVDEAAVFGTWVGALIKGPVSQTRSVVYFPWSNGPLIGMKVTPECTVALLIGPMLLAGAIVTGFTRSSFVRIAGGLLAGIALVIVVNQVRIAVIAVATQRWGLPGYNLAHQLIGTVIAMAGFVLAIVVMLGITTGHWRVPHRRREAV